MRKELKRIAKASKHWDGKVCKLQVTDADDKTLTLRALVGAQDSSKAWDLRCEVREKLITHLQRKQPSALPSLRIQRKTPRKAI